MVKVMAGKDKGKTGKVAKVIPSEEKIIVEGMNIKKKHMKPKSKGRKGMSPKSRRHFTLPAR